MTIPEGWLSVQQAADAAGIPEREVSNRAARIDPKTVYTTMGLTLNQLQQMGRSNGILGLKDQTPESLPLRKGSELKSLHKGKIIVSAEMVAWWKRVEDHQRELLTRGYRTATSVAEELGVSVREVKEGLKEIDQERRAGGLQRG